MKTKKLFLVLILSLVKPLLFAQNPIISGQFCADPTAKVFNDKLYLYPSHDIPSPIDELKTWFCMPDYHVFSSENMVDWQDHGVILTQDSVPWMVKNSYTLWAPDCISKNGKYYFYFPAACQSKKNYRIGVAIANHPEGPFKIESKPIDGIHGIDPCVFTDHDGQSYIYWADKGLNMAKMDINMLQLASSPQKIEGLPKGFVEGPFVFERNGIYYLTYPWVKDKTETLAYAVSDSPMGPFKYTGLIMEQSPSACWTNHHSLVEWKGQWYLFYHHNDYSPEFDKNRSVRIDSLTFNPDGTIQQVVPTLRGVGLTDARTKIQLDRYTAVSKNTYIDYLDVNDKFLGWKTLLKNRGAWIKYNSVDFGKAAVQEISVRYKSDTDAKIKILVEDSKVPLAVVSLNKTTDWQVMKTNVSYAPVDVHNLIVSLMEGTGVEIDWIGFDRLPWDKGAFETRKYRNLLAEMGYSDEYIQKKVDEAFNNLFYGPNKVYFEVGDSMAYVSDIKNHDARTEGMSYGMMAAVQFNKKDIFDRLWRWSKHYMQFQSGPKEGYFRWSMNVDGTSRSNGAASDGELYYVTALIFASNLWGNDTGINYLAEAQRILNCSVKKMGKDNVVSFINLDKKLITFTPDKKYGGLFTDPSYHLPAFYEVWARWAYDGRSDLWYECARRSREFLHTCIHPDTGLNPDYCNYDGSLLHRNRIIGDAFRFDSWRVPMNITLDYSWSCADKTWQRNYANKIQRFFYRKGIEKFVDQYNIDGTDVKDVLKAGSHCQLRHSLGLVASLAATSMVSSHIIGRDFVEHFLRSEHKPYDDGYFDAYFDGFLRLFALMHLSGQYQIIYPQL